MTFISLPILIFSPLLMALVLLIPGLFNNSYTARWFTRGFCLLHFIYSLFFLLGYAEGSGYAYASEIRLFGGALFESIGSSVSFGVDELSLLMIVLTTFIMLLSVIASKYTICERQKYFYALLLFLEFTILGVFCAKDAFLFFIFWELELIPMYFLISMWGTGRAKYSAMKFVLYTFFGSLGLLLAIGLMIQANHSAGLINSLDFSIITSQAFMYPPVVKGIMFAGLFLAFAVKLPIVPLHTWLLDAHGDAPTPVSMLLAGILLKMGAYGLIRFNLMLLPQIFEIVALVFIILGVINIIWASLLAFSQDDFKRIIAASSIAHMGLVIIGLGTFNETGFCGAVFQMFAHGIISAGMFMAVGAVYLRTGTRDIRKLSGLGKFMPKLMYFTLILSLSMMSVPLFIGFPGELLAFIGMFQSFVEPVFVVKILAAAAIFSIVLNAAYVLRLFHSVFYSVSSVVYQKLHDITPYETVVLGSFALVSIILGVYPSGLLAYIKSFVNSIMIFGGI